MSSAPLPDATPVSPTDAAFAGFRLLRREPRTLIVWFVASLILSLAMVAPMVALAGPTLMQLQGLNAAAAAGAPRPGPSEILGLFGRLLPVYGLIMLVWFAAASVMNAAAIRAVLRPGTDRAGHFRLGADELRQAAVLFLLGLVFLALYVAVALVIAVLVAVAAAAAGAGRGGGGSDVGLIVVVGLVELVAVLGAFAVMAFVGVRLSLASALTFDSGRVRLFGSWPLTRRRFWPLLGAYVLAGVIMAVLYIVVLTAFAAIGAATAGLGVTGSVLQPDMTSLATYFTPLQALYLLVSAGLTATWMVVQAATPAELYLQITRGGSSLAVFGPTDTERSIAFGNRI